MSPGFLKSLLAVYRLEILLEWRNRARIFAIFVFAVILSVLYHYAMEADFFRAARNLTGTSLTTLFFSSLLLTGWGTDSTDTASFRVLLLAPLDRAGMFMARALLRWQVLCLLLAAYLPVNDILLTGRLTTVSMFSQNFALLALTALSLASLGTLFNSMVAQRGRGIILPLLLLPASIPVLILASGALDRITDPTAEFSVLPTAAMLAPGVLYSSLGALLFPLLYDEGPFTS